jgi:hypothetical protein
VIEQDDEWLVGKRYLSNHSLEAVLDQEKKDNKTREETRELNAARAANDLADELNHVPGLDCRSRSRFRGCPRIRAERCPVAAAGRDRTVRNHG